MDPDKVAEAAKSQAKMEGGAASAYDRLSLRRNGLRLQRFVDELVADSAMNRTSAALRVKVSPNSASSTGGKWFRDPEVQAAIVERLADRRKRLELSQDQVLAEMSLIASSDIRAFIEWEEDGRARFKPSHRLGPEARAIKEVRVKANGDLVFKLHDKQGVLKLLAAHADLVTDRPATTVRVVVLDPGGKEVPLALPPVGQFLDVEGGTVEEEDDDESDEETS